jgi:hypothetical protein
MDIFYSVVQRAHVLAGSLALLSFLWVFIELYVAGERSHLPRLRAAAILGTVFLVVTWVVGGYLYVQLFEPIEERIETGPFPWVYAVLFDWKEHVFHFLPFVGLSIAVLFSKAGDRIVADGGLRRAVLTLTFLLVVVIALLAVVGATVAATGRLNLME